MGNTVVLGIGAVILALVVVWEVIQSKRIDELQNRISLLEKK